MGSFRRYPLLVPAAVVALMAAVPALADDPPPPTPPTTPSIDQYVETVPTASGAASHAKTTRRRTTLTPAVTARLRNSRDAYTRRLKAVATSAAYGAPTRALSAPSGQTTAATEGDSGNALSAAVSAMESSDDSHVFWLLGLLIVVTATMVWVAARKHRA
jgi:cobalamin biosynthesis Mg chelatase CobN